MGHFDRAYFHYLTSGQLFGWNVQYTVCATRGLIKNLMWARETCSQMRHWLSWFWKYQLQQSSIMELNGTSLAILKTFEISRNHDPVTEDYPQIIPLLWANSCRDYCLSTEPHRISWEENHVSSFWEDCPFRVLFPHSSALTWKLKQLNKSQTPSIKLWIILDSDDGGNIWKNVESFQDMQNFSMFYL